MINNIHFYPTQYQKHNLSFKANISKRLIAPAVDTVQISSSKIQTATGISAIVAGLIANADKSDKVVFEDCIKSGDCNDFNLYRK